MRRAVLLIVPVLVVAGCSSSGGSGKSSTSAAPKTSNSATSSAATALAAKMRDGLDGLTSAHVVVDAGALGGKSSGDFAFANGKATASDITTGTGTDRTEIVTIGTTSYAKLPSGRNTSGKPWVKVSSTSKNEFVRALASQLDLSKAAASLPDAADLVGTATQVRQRGANSYTIVIDPSKSSSTTIGSLLGAIGQKTVPLDLTLDSAGRPTHVAIATSLGGQSLKFTLDVSKFNAPVHISAPARGEISSD